MASEEVIRTFVATGENGREFRISVFQPHTEIRSRGGAQSRPGLPRYRTDDGHAVNRIGKGVYEIVPLALRVTSDDPDAP